MIKIELNDEKREKIERIFLEDLVDGTSRDKRQRKKGKLIEDLNNCRPCWKGTKLTQRHIIFGSWPNTSTMIRANRTLRT